MLVALFASYKEDIPYAVTYLNWTLVFEWYVVGSGSKNKHQKGFTCLKESRLLNMATILGAVLNINDMVVGGGGSLNEHKKIILIMNKIFI